MRRLPCTLLILAATLPAQRQLVLRDAEPVFGLDPIRIAAGELADGDPDLVLQATTVAEAVLVNRHPQLAAPGEPVPGGAHTLVVHSEPSYTAAPGLAVPLIAPWPGHTPIPSIGLDGRTMAALPAVILPAPTDEARVVIRVPSQPSLRGARVFSQVLLSTGAGLRLTGAAADTIR